MRSSSASKRQQRPDVALARGSKNQLVLTGLGESRCCDQSIRLLRRHFPSLIAILLERRKVVAPLIELAVSDRPQFLPTPRPSPGADGDELGRRRLVCVHLSQRPSLSRDGRRRVVRHGHDRGSRDRGPSDRSASRRPAIAPLRASAFASRRTSCPNGRAAPRASTPFYPFSICAGFPPAISRRRSPPCSARTRPTFPRR